MSTAPALEFTVLGASCVEDAAAPTLRVDLGVSETTGLDVFTIALTAQINIDPARRSYDAETRTRLVDLFGEPERWSATTHSFLWAYSSALVPSFTGTQTFSLPVACTYDLELAATKYFTGLRGGHIPLTFHFSGSVLVRGPGGAIQVVAIPWSCSAKWRMPVADLAGDDGPALPELELGAAAPRHDRVPAPVHGRCRPVLARRGGRAAARDGARPGGGVSG